MRSLLALAAALGLVALLPLPAKADSPASAPALAIVYNGKTTAFTADQIAAVPHQSATAYNYHEKAVHTYGGVPVHDLLAEVGVAFGEKLRGTGLRQVVVVHCRDGYAIVFALAEFDPDFNPRTILLSDTEDGKPTSAGQGPLRLVVPGDKRPARWARQVTSLEIVSVGSGR